jgi:hypothetical protein
VFMWWTAQRPDDVYFPGSTTQRPWVASLIPAGTSQDDFEASFDRFVQMQKNWAQLRVVVGSTNRFEEES